MLDRIRFVLFSAFGLVFYHNCVVSTHEISGFISNHVDSTDYIDVDEEEVRAVLACIRSGLPRSHCPPGFVHLAKADRCYKVLDGRSAWSLSSYQCQNLYDGARLAVIKNENQNNAIKGLIASEISKNPSMDCRNPHYRDGGHVFWTGGQRRNASDCSSEFVWKLPDGKQLPMTFTDWKAGEPNCYWGNEACMHFWPDRQYLWNDSNCGHQLCAICEYDPHVQAEPNLS